MITERKETKPIELNEFEVEEIFFMENLQPGYYSLMAAWKSEDGQVALLPIHRIIELIS